MRRKSNLYAGIMLLLVVLLLSVLSGCGGGGNQNTDGNPAGVDTPAISDAGNEETSPPEDSGEEEKHDPTPTEGDTVTASSIEELLEAIGPNVGIMIEPGYYNLSEYIEDVWEQEGESWNERHPYVQLRDCYDGVEVVIRRVEGLSIFGDNESLTEIVVDPRYAQVLNFEECHDLTLSGLTMGHTETGDCAGNVLDFYNCRDIHLSAMDLYGCGVYGIGCYDGTGELYVYSSTIRDCSYGALQIYDGNGCFEFRNCMLTGSDGYDHYEKSPWSDLAFYECVFGDNETSYYMFLEDVYTEDCIWSENYIYPEYGYDELPVFEPETMEYSNITKELLVENSWEGYAMVDPESGETVMLPYTESDNTYHWAYLEMYVEKFGWFENGNDYSGNITWDCDEDNHAWITLEDGRTYYMTAYTMGGAGHIWLLLELEERLVWLY